MTDRAIPSHTPRQHYEAELARLGYERDASQVRAVEALDELHAHLLAAPAPSWWQRVLGKDVPPVKGLYLWGGVGRGKTWLMDGFFEGLPVAEKRRLHFHRFMHEVHARLKALPDREDPLKDVAAGFREQARVLCFDEFFVSDITDAMLLGRLFQQLFALGVTLVATSNLPPDELYKDGLQRARFLPAIRLLKHHTRVLNVDGGTDYRLRHMQGLSLYHVPAGPGADAALAGMFEHLTGQLPARGDTLLINDRPIPARRHADGVAWFDFAALCTGPRSPEDYIEIARSFHTLLLSDIPPLGPEQEDEARRFIALVDELYDRRVKLAASAAVSLEGLYTGRRLGFEFQRAQSRLTEMQTKAYLSLPHLP